MTYAQLFSAYEAELLAVGEEAESLSFVYRTLKNLDLTAFVFQLRQEVSDEDKEFIRQIFQQLKAHTPAQYIIGFEDFHGLRFKVDERVLIPRPETEELVDLILKENGRADLQVLDIGTGSGAIAISLAQARPDWKVTASDISAEALALAKENAEKNATPLHCVQSDVFSHITGTFDIIVSNPPYISYEDVHEVGVNVLESEPHLALFAEEDGLAIYRQIIQEAAAFLTETGRLYFEIGYKQGQQVADLLRQHFPKKQVRVLKDAFGKDRMVVCHD